MQRMNYIQKIKRTIARLRGSTIEYNLAAYQKIVDQIMQLESSLIKKSDRQLQSQWSDLKKRYKKEQNLNSILVNAYALIREAAKRTLGLRPFEVQIMAGIVMHEGKLAEMQTGEGKTLAAVFPVVLNALAGKGVHVLTFNDYLARRDAQWMGPVYTFLGLCTGFIRQGLTTEERRQAYAADITYVTAKEAGFDYLRDSLANSDKDIVHRSFQFAVIDEADSILIDEARIPLILAGQTENEEQSITDMHVLIDRLVPATDFETDEYARNIHLTDKGAHKVEQQLRCGNLYNGENYHLLTRINCALHAQHLLKRDIDYIVRNGKIEQVDEFTGRVVDGRRWPDGLQAAVEAKEGLTGEVKGTILNSIALQHFIRQYPKICAMTATAVSAEEEFNSIYGLHIVVIPANKPCIRFDHEDVLFKDKQSKWQALIAEIAAVHCSGQPVLVGTCSVQESDQLGGLLHSKGIPCHILNAKNDAVEAKIVAQAGRIGAVTISTNMAGRGTDIRLGGSDEKEKSNVSALGGLYVIGTNRHESKRIDDQLRGRAGRQGDPGASRFFISLSDDLNERFRLKDLITGEKYTVRKNNVVDSAVIRYEVGRIQRIVEGQNWQIKKTLFKYSSLIEDQRRLFFGRRQEIFVNSNMLSLFKTKSPGCYASLKRRLGMDKLQELCRDIMLYHIDQNWSAYLAQIADIREGIHLRSITGFDPFFEFQKLAIEAFDAVQKRIEQDALKTFNRVTADTDVIDPESLGIKAPSATWTYVINDAPFGHDLGAQLMGNMAMNVGGAMLTPLLYLEYLWRRRKQKIKG
jgi:preprotein translocase subunit SecA